MGRKEELGVLLGAADALRDGRSSVVTICAEAGAGKTRLLEEFRANAEGDVRWLEGRAYPYTADTPYAALIDLLNRVARIDENDRAAEVKAKLDDMVAAVLPDDTEAAAVIGHLYGLEVNRTIDLEAFRTRLLDVLGRLLDEVARQGPTVLIFQDLHWVDPSTASLIRRLVTSLSAPLLTVCNFRPGFTLGVEGERALQLGVLSRRETGALVESLLDSAVAPDGLVAWLADRTDGNPFFVEEIVNSLIDKEVLVRTDAGWNLAGALADDTVPPTIRGLLAARIDGLSPDARRVLREASVVGREFLYRIMASVTDTPADLESGIARLSAADFIRENNLDPELEYIFKHALTQEVAYEGLLIRDRQRLHERVAQGIELHLSDRIDEFVDTLAYHYERSGHVVEAVRYLRSAAKKAVDRFAVEEADRKYAAAYALLTAEEAVGVVISADDRDRLLLEVLTDWAVVFYYSCDLHRFDALYERHRELGDAVGDDTLAARWNAWAGMLTWLHRADNRAAGQMLLGAIERAQKVGDPVAEGMARSWMVWIDWT
ncbi:MAG: AAA family ATPase, partial [Acidimicrobiales bacterium]|nr:AAA family ATPase [Acidimicrobiales bacterium]